MEGLRQIIGRFDRIDLPDFGAINIGAKIDTGAYSSAIHCSKIKLYKKKGKRYISFHILDSHIPVIEHRRYITSRFRKKKVRSSSGHVEKRYFIETYIILFGEKILVEFSLSDRENMRFPVLLGRKMLKNRFLVDVALIDVSYHQKMGQSDSEKNNPDFMGLDIDAEE
ncbi:RimK/LysX family protein [Cytophagaceae bacterium YF14B1]|uniref:RimK/LysX family protein n=1 Tax=Xanthocytophaga flava TaxID=3048013 RepID=A0AAE3QUD7_9BACT|nr:RimK/LysX family protein [Xanthocytophaga flavus]MDJ1483415.1 RimK/LysX family protein [Xanthocytophaga flavus]